MADGPYDSYRDFQYLSGTINTGASSFVETNLTPSNVAWLVQRVAITGATNGGCSLYLNSSSSPANLIDGEFVNAAIAAWTPGDKGLYIPKGSTLVVRFFNQPASQDCTYNIRVATL